MYVWSCAQQHRKQNEYDPPCQVDCEDSSKESCAIHHQATNIDAVLVIQKVIPICINISEDSLTQVMELYTLYYTNRTMCVTGLLS